jgi:separase
MLIANSEHTLSAAHIMARDDKDFMGLTNPSTTLSGRIRFNRILADACFVSSLLSAHLGNLKLAAIHARQSIVLNRRIWAALETRSNMKKPPLHQNTETDAHMAKKATFDPLSSIRNEKGMPLVMSVTHNALSGADFWPLVPSLYRALMHHSFVFAQQGLLHEALYVAEQAEKVAMATSSPSLVMKNVSQRIEYCSDSGRVEKAQSILDSLDQTCCEKHIAKLAYHSAVAKLYQSNKEFGKELAAYDSMEKLLAELTSPSHIKLVEAFQSSVESMVEGMGTMSLDDALSADTRLTKRLRNRQPVPKAAPRIVAKTSTRITRKAPHRSVPAVVPKAKQKTLTPQYHEKTSPAEQCVSFDTLRTDVIFRKAMANLLRNDLTNALKLLETIDTHEDTERDVFHVWVRFKAMLSQAINNVAEDFTLNTLPESTIAFPAMPLSARKSSEGTTTKQSAVTTIVKTTRGKKQVKEDFAITLRSARELLEKTHALCATTGSNHAFQQVSAALGHVTILLSAVSGSQSHGFLHPLYVAYMSGMYYHHQPALPVLTAYRNCKM